jgi:hypothetical protein
MKISTQFDIGQRVKIRAGKLADTFRKGFIRITSQLFQPIFRQTAQAQQSDMPSQTLIGCPCCGVDNYRRVEGMAQCYDCGCRWVEGKVKRREITGKGEIDESLIWEKAAQMAADEADSYYEHNPPMNSDACLNLLAMKFRAMKFRAIAKTLPKRRNQSKDGGSNGK